MPKLVALSEVSDADIALVGGKAGKLGELVRLGLPVPPGLVVTTEAYQEFVEGAGILAIIQGSMGSIDPAKNETVEAASRTVRAAFESAQYPEALRTEILDRVHRYEKEHHVRFSAVRSSATAEDLEGASFAGLQETYLNVTGDAAILEAIRKCWGSLFTARVLVYRAKKGFDHRTIRLAVLIQKMVDSRVSGILFTKDPNTGENHMIVEAGFGLGEAIV
ncbi:MAG: phosphoenolpyruvate synthase, partial [Thermoplasmata archaeon]|nr:phosphoenolpyruvate synthase [Thermoplasmata archaeon]